MPVSNVRQIPRLAMPHAGQLGLPVYFQYPPPPNGLPGRLQPHGIPNYTIHAHHAQTPHVSVYNTIDPVPCAPHDVIHHEPTNKHPNTSRPRFGPLSTQSCPREDPAWQRGKPSEVLDAGEKVAARGQHVELASPYRPRAPVASMVPQHYGRFHFASQRPKIHVEGARTAQKVEEAERDVESDSDNWDTCSSGSSETLTFESDDDATDDSHDEGNSVKANDGSNDGSDDGSDDGSNYADGVIDIQPTRHRGENHGKISGSVDVDNSLLIDRLSGYFHLGSQWQVPESSIAQSNAGIKFGMASILSEHQRYDATAQGTPDSNATSAEANITGRLRDMHLASPRQKLERPSPQNTSRFGEHTQSPSDPGQHQTAGNHYSNAIHTGEVEDNDPVFVISEDPMSVDISMSGAYQPNGRLELLYKLQQ
ncbi:hypothetical protein NUW58_g3720 [Xylaria curta]|uniref:Uncharacterized protein n=1 Tax=Xylaria curta TaxID=42375 RepID=A0ACC1PB65_9PEZI|nr:hypothetical protein NUW58_g3720 [Xylaria curta]